MTRLSCEMKMAIEVRWPGVSCNWTFECLHCPLRESIDDKHKNHLMVSIKTCYENLKDRLQAVKSAVWKSLPLFFIKYRFYRNFTNCYLKRVQEVIFGPFRFAIEKLIKIKFVEVARLVLLAPKNSLLVFFFSQVTFFSEILCLRMSL